MVKFSDPNRTDFINHQKHWGNSNFQAASLRRMLEKFLILSFLGYASAQFELFNSTGEYEHDGFDENDVAGISNFWDFSYMLGDTNQRFCSRFLLRRA